MAGVEQQPREKWDWVPYLVVSWALAFGLVCVGCAWQVGLIPPPQTYQFTIIGHNCGTVYLGDTEGAQPYDADNGEQCLWDAHLSCQTATLEVIDQGFETGSDKGITSQRQGKTCAVSIVVIAWGEGKLFAQSAETRTAYQCARLEKQENGLAVNGCGDLGDEFIPARPADQLGHVCGIVGGHYPIALELRRSSNPGLFTTANVEDCFWRVYTMCQQPATLLFDEHTPVTATSTPTSASDTPPADSARDHTLVVQRLHEACSLTDHVTSFAGDTPTSAAYTCANLTRGPNSALTAHRCGAERDVVIPAPPAATPTP